MTLSEVVREFPPEAGIVELLGYIQIAKDDGHIISRERSEDIQVDGGRLAASPSHLLIVFLLPRRTAEYLTPLHLRSPSSANGASRQFDCCRGSSRGRRPGEPLLSNRSQIETFLACLVSRSSSTKRRDTHTCVNGKTSAEWVRAAAEAGSSQPTRICPRCSPCCFGTSSGGSKKMIFTTNDALCRDRRHLRPMEGVLSRPIRRSASAQEFNAAPHKLDDLGVRCESSPTIPKRGKSAAF